jgi:hypothetical protein
MLQKKPAVDAGFEPMTTTKGAGALPLDYSELTQPQVFQGYMTQCLPSSLFHF